MLPVGCVLCPSTERQSCRHHLLRTRTSTPRRSKDQIDHTSHFRQCRKSLVPPYRNRKSTTRSVPTRSAIECITTPPVNQLHNLARLWFRRIQSRRSRLQALLCSAVFKYRSCPRGRVYTPCGSMMNQYLLGLIPKPVLIAADTWSAFQSGEMRTGFLLVSGREKTTSSSDELSTDVQDPMIVLCGLIPTSLRPVIRIYGQKEITNTL